MEYTTLICDLRNSRRLNNREKIQYKLIDVLKEANQLFASELAVPFIITLGDEWQGLLKPDASYQDILEFFRTKLPEVEFSSGIGIGDITINNFELTVNQLDGPAFHKARKAIKIAKQNKYSEVLIK